jgi:2-methylisocitrate lyase-like PEP mutase family enzyme
MHRSPPLLVLPNAWDAASARIFENADFPAIATTSAGVANALGYPDGQRLPFEEMLSAIARIVQTVQVPVSADIEAGYGEIPEAVADHCRSVIAAGAVGVNLEDGSGVPDRPLVDEALHCEKIRAVREASSREGIHLVINARTDVYLANVGAPETRLAQTLRRANAYRRAGADCLFVPAVTDAATIGEIVRGIDGPVNVLAGPGTPPVRDLERLGVARVGLGSGPMRATLGLLARLAAELRESGTFRTLAEAMPYGEVNRLFERPRSG